MKILTERQHDVLRAIRTATKSHGYPPSLRELCGALGLKNVNAIKWHLIALERKGYIERDRGISRGIRLVERSNRNRARGEENGCRDRGAEVTA